MHESATTIDVNLPKWIKRTKDEGRPAELWAFPAALTGVILAGMVVGTGAGYGLWVGLNRPDLGGAGAWDATDTLDLVRIVLIVIGGLGGVVALVVAYRKQRIAEGDSRRENTKLFNERFTAASGQLGHDSAAVRLAGVYAMAGL